MSFTVVDAVSAPGRAGRANEDGWGTSGRFAWVIDGATGLGDSPLLQAPSDAAWLTAAMGRAFSEAAQTAASPMDLLAAASSDCATRFLSERTRPPAERFEVPTAAVLVAKLAPGRIEVAELGDCALVVSSGGSLTRVGGTETGKALESDNAARMMAGGAGRTAEVTNFLRAVRNKANQPGGYPIFAPEAGCESGARQHTITVGAEGEGLLLTDGYEAAVEDYALYDLAGLLSAARSDVKEPLARLRAVEEADADCTRYPRFKQSDDATALFVSFC